MSDECGIIVAAYGQKYIEESMPLLNSIRRTMPSLGVTLVTDNATEVSEDLFDRVIRIDVISEIEAYDSEDFRKQIGESKNSFPKLIGFFFKVKALAHTPYKYTLFLDADTIIGHPVYDMFHLLKKYDVLVGYAPTKTSSEVGATPLDELKSHAAVPRINTGMVAYSHTALEKGFVDSWEKLMIAGIERGKHNSRAKYGDQSEFRSLVWESSASVFVLPVEYHLRSGNTAVLDGPVRILHGRPSGGRDALISFLNSTHEKRIWMAPAGMRKASDNYERHHSYRESA